MMPYWFVCFAEKNNIYKDSKNLPQSTGSIKQRWYLTVTRATMIFFGTVMKFQFIKATLCALISELLKSLDDLISSLYDRTLFPKTLPAI